MDWTLPGNSLDVQFEKLWERFQRLPATVETINGWRQRLQRWLTPVNVSFIVPIEDQAVCDYLGQAQVALTGLMAYAPQPQDKLHITLYQVGYLRTGLPLRGTWTHESLARIEALARHNLALLEPFEVLIGPINAFPNVPIAEVHDYGRLRLLKTAVSQALPPLQRMPSAYPLIPHITLGYFGERPVEPIRRAMQPLRDLEPVSMTVDRVDMTLYYRETGPYDPAQALLHSIEHVIATIHLGEG